MPAIHPARLKHQVAAVVEQYSKPIEFVRHLHSLLEVYADRVVRPGESLIAHSSYKAYRVPNPVLNQIIRELVPSVISDPQVAIELCDLLWKEPYLEFRVLAVTILGAIKPDPLDPVLERVCAWVKPSLADSIMTKLINGVFSQLVVVNPDKCLSQVEQWLKGKDPFYIQIGLRALIPMLEVQAFQSLPVVYRFISPFMHNVPANLRGFLLEVLGALAERSPQETAYFLLHHLTLSSSPDSSWLIRYSMSFFPDELQHKLRTELEEYSSD